MVQRGGSEVLERPWSHVRAGAASPTPPPTAKLNGESCRTTPSDWSPAHAHSGHARRQLHDVAILASGARKRDTPKIRESIEGATGI